MIRNMLSATVATAAMLIAVPSVAHPGGGGGGGVAPQMGAGGHAGLSETIGSRMGGIGSSIESNLTSRMENSGAASLSSRIQSNQATRITNGGSSAAEANRLAHQPSRLEGEVDNEGLMHASPEGIRNAAPNSILARGALPSALLPGITTGLSVQASGGATLGTITNVLTTRNGSIAGVTVTAANGQTFRIPAAALSISGNVVTVNTTEAFESGKVPTALLPGLTTGLSVTSNTGVALGTITSVQGENGSVRYVTVTAANGQTYQVPANALSVSANGVTVNTAEAFERGGVPSSLLPGLTTGLTVNTAAGASFGTISQVITGTNGNITSVVVTSASGQTYVVPAASLTVSGNAVTVANAGEAFGSTGVPAAFLPGLTTGLSVDSSAGTSLGTVSQVIMSSNGAISGVLVTSSSGQSYVLPATDLSISGNVVTVASAGF